MSFSTDSPADRPTSTPSPAPAQLYSVITEYDRGQLVPEHFLTEQARRSSLIERIDQFADDEQLADIVASLLQPATITLAESALDQTTGVYRPTGNPLLVL